MADSSVAISAGTGTPIRVLTGLGAGSADQQVVTLADSAGNLLGTAAAPFPVGSVGDVAATGTMAALNATVAIATGGRGTTAIEITGTWVGTISFQGTSDPAGTAAVTANWYQVNAPTPTVTALPISTTANGLFRVNSAGYTAVRVIMSAYTSGTATAWVNTAAQSSMVTVAEPVTIGADPDSVVTGTLSATDAVVAAPAGNGALLSGTPTAGSSLQILCAGGDSSWDIQLSGTFGSGTVYTEGSFDGGVNWINLNGRQTGVVNTVLGYGFTTAGLYRGNTSGTTHIRARIVGATTPSVSVTIRIASGVGAVFMNASIPAGSNTIGNVGIVAGAAAIGTVGVTSLPALTAGTNYVGQVRLTDGTNNPAVKAASTAVAATDPSLAVGLHPSSPLPAGANVVGAVGIGATTQSAIAVTSAATTNASSQKASAGNLYELTVSNPTATAAYVKFYNKASAPTVGTDVPILTIRAAATGAAGDMQSFNFGANGKRFTLGIAVAITALAAATDTGVAVAGVQVHGTYV